MSPISGPWSANVSRTLRETLEAFASELVTSEILMNALADGGYDAPPERADDLEDFANGPLRAEITAVLGGEVADAVVEGLGPVLVMMRRSERDTSAPSATSTGEMPVPANIAPPPGPSEVPTIAPSPPPPAPVVRALRPVSRPDLPSLPRPDFPSMPPARAAIPIPPTLLQGARHAKTAKSTPPARPATPAPRPQPAEQELSPRRTQRAQTGTDLIDLAVVTGDEALTAELGTKFAGRRLVVGPSLAEMPRARVVLVDTRHAFDELSSTWPAARAPHVAVLWPADNRERGLFEAVQPHVPRVVCAGDEAELSDVVMLVMLQLTPP